MGAKIMKNAKNAFIRGAPSWRAPSCSPIAAVSAPSGRGNEECDHLDYMLTKINQMGVFCVVLHFLSGSFTGGRTSQRKNRVCEVARSQCGYAEKCVTSGRTDRMYDADGFPNLGGYGCVEA